MNKHNPLAKRVNKYWWTKYLNRLMKFFKFMKQGWNQNKPWKNGKASESIRRKENSRTLYKIHRSNPKYARKITKILNYKHKSDQKSIKLPNLEPIRIKTSQNKPNSLGQEPKLTPTLHNRVVSDSEDGKVATWCQWNMANLPFGRCAQCKTRE